LQSRAPETLDVRDDESIELPDLETARGNAVRCARVTFAEAAKDEGRVGLHHRIAIADEQGAVLETLRLRDTVRVEE